MPENLNEYAIYITKLFAFGVFWFWGFFLVTLSHKVRKKKMYSYDIILNFTPS